MPYFDSKNIRLSYFPKICCDKILSESILIKTTDKGKHNIYIGLISNDNKCGMFKCKLFE